MKIFQRAALLLACFALWNNRTISQATRVSDELPRPSQVQVRGMLGESVLLAETGRLRSLPRWHNGELINMFTPEARKRNNTTDWYGEHAGKWLYSASLAVDRTGDDSLRALLVRTADFLVANQESDGYMGSYSPALRITNPTSTQHKKSWDTWSLACTLSGLVELYREIPDEKYLASAKKIGQLLLNTFGDGTAKITDYGTRYGYSATVVLDPVVELYKTTNDKRYLDFAELIVREVEEKEGLKFIAAALAKRDMETVADGKAYQVIWNINGVAKLYEVTGKPEYLQAVRNAWENIRDYHLTATGGPWGGIGKHKECFNTKGYWNPEGFVETCSIMAWIQLNKSLLRLTGEAKYAQEAEKSYYNALPGAQMANGQDWTYHSFNNGRRFAANFNDCCPSSGVLALEELSPMIYSRRADGIACNIFSASEARIGLGDKTTVNVSQQTDYPASGKIRLILKVSDPKKFPLFIRIPDWAAGAKISVNGHAIDKAIEPSSYCTLNPGWQKENVVEISFPMEMRVIRHDEYATMPQGTADLYRAHWFALTRGPLVYASDGLIDGKDRERNFAGASKKPETLFTPAKTLNKDGTPNFVLRAPGTNPLSFTPFYEAGGRQAGTWRLTWMQAGVDE